MSVLLRLLHDQNKNIYIITEVSQGGITYVMATT